MGSGASGANMHDDDQASAHLLSEYARLGAARMRAKTAVRLAVDLAFHMSGAWTEAALSLDDADPRGALRAAAEAEVLARRPPHIRRPDPVQRDAPHEGTARAGHIEQRLLPMLAAGQFSAAVAYVTGGVAAALSRDAAVSLAQRVLAQGEAGREEAQVPRAFAALVRRLPARLPRGGAGALVAAAVHAFGMEIVDPARRPPSFSDAERAVVARMCCPVVTAADRGDPGGRVTVRHASDHMRMRTPAPRPEGVRTGGEDGDVENGDDAAAAKVFEFEYEDPEGAHAGAVTEIRLVRS